MRSSAAGLHVGLRLAILHFILPRNHTNCFCRPSSVAPNSPCTSAPSGHLGCMVLLSATVKNGHAWGFGFGCGSGRGSGSQFYMVDRPQSLD